MDDRASGIGTYRPSGFPRGQRHAGLTLARVALLSSFLLLCLASAWLTHFVWHGPDPRNTPEILLSAPRDQLHKKLPPLAEPKTELSAEDLAFGEAQVACMARERPELGHQVSSADLLWKFCARGFAGEAVGERILWDSGLPKGDDHQSDHQSPYRGRQGYIRIRKNLPAGIDLGRPLSCEELWSCAVFELENIRNTPAFNSLFEMALNGELTREQWIRENSELEYGALRRTARDFVQLWLPLARIRHFSTTPSLWGADVPRTYKGWILLYRDPNGYPWSVFGSAYDRQIVPYVRSRHLQRASP